MLSDIKITLIGPGVMAEAMLKGLLNKKLAKPQHICISGPNAERNQELHTVYGVQSFTDNRAAAAQADIVVLAIKPQRMEKVVGELKGSLKADAFILSIIAGASIAKITRLSGHKRIVRCMPNTPAQIGEGITVWTASPQVSAAQQEMTRTFLNAFGKEIFVEEEDYLDKATALSGTGPAYVYLFMEAMVDAGVHLGFPRRIAERLVIETLRGSVDYYDDGQSDAKHLASLRNQVTSPGGTSAEALYYLEKAGFRTAISRAIWAAYQRSKELGKDAETNPPEE
ncbi:MAG: pyrroline-5-carboxylate reductase [Anaerolineaceae bacterium]